MPVAVYLRVSTEEQRERQSIATQREFAEGYCALHSLSVYRTYADDGVSGTIPLEQRSEAGQMLRDARAGRFDLLLIYKLDRLGRDTRLILNGVAELEKLGVRVRSMTEEFEAGSATGRLMLTMLSGFATHEREVIRERSVAGTNRVAQAGAWLGGVVPFGYRKIGTKGEARLVISEDPIPGMAMSEAEVIRQIFHMAAVERKSCRIIAERLNSLGVPCAYTRDDRLVLRGKRKERTSGAWRPGRVRWIITNTTYKGIHVYGKRSKAPRSLIPRAVPVIIGEDVWQKAQENLHSHFRFGARNCCNQYLLRGLIKCGLCGLNYSGIPGDHGTGKREFYYRCNAASNPALRHAKGRCGSKSIRGDQLEQQVWADVQAFLRNPKPVMERLQARMEGDLAGLGQVRKQITRLEGLVAEKAAERERMLSLYRRGRLTDPELDVQMEEIGREEASLQAQIAELRGKIAGAESIGANVASAEGLLEKLRKRLDQPISFEQKRRLIEILVAGIRVDTVETNGVKRAQITVTYRFSQPSEAMPILLPQSYSTGKVVRIPVEPKTVGDHIRKKRLAMKLLQKDVAKQVGVCTPTIFNWEKGSSQPDHRYIPAIIQFLGYNPVPEPTTTGERVVWHRTTLGLSQKEAAVRIGVDQSTLARWERGEKEPWGKYVALAENFLSTGEQQRSESRRAG